MITRIDLNMELKPKICEPCMKSKATVTPYPKESDTQAQEYSEHVHWDLWGPVSLNGHYYTTAQLDDATCKTKVYFQEKS